MPRFLKRILIAIAAIVVAGLVAFQWMKARTKRHSPEETYTWYAGDLQLKVTYCRPFKKGRDIFGGLVPFGKVWRTGANEATVLDVNKDITFGGTPVKAGRYTLWTLPGPEQWEVYLNSGTYSWGVDMDGNALRDPAKDVAVANAPVTHLPEPVEQFTILVNDAGTDLVLQWDDVLIAVPITH